MKCDGLSNEGCPTEATRKGVKKYDNTGNVTWLCGTCAQKSNIVTSLIRANSTSSPWSNDELAQNELLCFLNNWLTCECNQIKSICLSFYTDDEIKQPRCTIFDNFTGDSSLKKYTVIIKKKKKTTWMI